MTDKPAMPIIKRESGVAEVRTDLQKEHLDEFAGWRPRVSETVGNIGRTKVAIETAGHVTRETGN